MQPEGSDLIGAFLCPTVFVEGNIPVFFSPYITGNGWKSMLTLLTFLNEAESPLTYVTTRLDGACYIQLQIFYVHKGIVRSDSTAASLHRILTLDALY